MNDDPDERQARDHLRSHREGVLIADGVADRIRFVIDSITGRIVFPTTPHTAEAREMVLFVPEEAPQDVDELQLLLVPASLNSDRNATCDRWQAYHGEVRLTHWLGCSVESARFAGKVVEADLMNQPNPLAEAESAFCRLINTDHARLSALCSARAGVAPRDPMACGVDDTGIDVRARFGIIRIAFPHSAADPADAEQMIREMLEQA